MSPYVLHIVCKLPTLIPVDDPTLPVYRILVFGFYQHFLNGPIAFEVGLDTILATYLLNAFSLSLCIDYDYMSLTVFILVGAPPCGVTTWIVEFFTWFSMGVTVFLAVI